MSITNRLSIFFLSTLAIVLFGFSLTIYVLGDRYLHQQENDRLEHSEQTLVAAIEIHAEDVEWEPLERKVFLGEYSTLDQIRWALHDEEGNLIDCSQNLEIPDETRECRGWFVRKCLITAGKFEPLKSAKGPVFIEGALSDVFVKKVIPGNIQLPTDRTYHGSSLRITVATSSIPLKTTLYRFGLTLLVLPLIILFLATIWGRWLCRRALKPVFEMVETTRTIQNQLESKCLLHIPNSHDELQELGIAFNEILQALRLALDRERRFTADASHQLRTPLTAILGQIDVALRKERTISEYKRLLAILKNRGQELHQIIESLLFLARADSGESVPDLRIIDLRDWCDTWMEKWRDRPRSNDLKIISPTCNVLIYAQPSLLGQILDNLVDNAIKYSPSGSEILIQIKLCSLPKPTGDSAELEFLNNVNSHQKSEADLGADHAILSTCLAQQNPPLPNSQTTSKPLFSPTDYVSLSVIDHGSGIEKEDLPLIFQPFYRSKKARWVGTPGIGLGLTLVDRITHLLHGKLTVLSESGKGSEFQLCFPRVIKEN